MVFSLDIQNMMNDPSSDPLVVKKAIEDELVVPKLASKNKYG